MRVKYTVDGAAYYLNMHTNNITSSLGIKVASKDMLILCYQKNIAVLRDISQHLKNIYENERKGTGNKVKNTKTLHFMAQEILFHSDAYLFTEAKIKGLKIEQNKYTKILADTIDKLIVEPSKVADIGANITKDHDSLIINAGYSSRIPIAFIVNKQFYKIGELLGLSLEGTSDVWYECTYKGETKKVKK